MKKPDTKVMRFNLHEICRIDKSMDTESRFMVARGWKEEVIRIHCLVDMGISLGTMKTFEDLLEMVGTQHLYPTY